MKESLKAIYSQGPVTKFIDDPAILAQSLSRIYVALKMHVFNKDGNAAQVKLEEIFSPLEFEHNKTPKTILFKGRPGIGKSTITEILLDLWREGKILQHLEYVYKVKLKSLQNDSWKSEYQQYVQVHPLACLIHYSLRQVNTENLPVLSVPKIVEALRDRNALVIVDGYDDIQHSIRDNDSTKTIINQIFQVNYVVMTARPNSLDALTRNHFERIIEVDGLDNKGIKTYIEQYFTNLKDILVEEVNNFFTQQAKNKDSDARLLDYLESSTNPQSYGSYWQLRNLITEGDKEQSAIIEKIESHCSFAKIRIFSLLENNKAIKDLVSTPMNAAMLCVVYSGNDISEEDLLTLEGLYSKLIVWLSTRFEDKVSIRGTGKTVEDVLKALQEIAYKGLDGKILSSAEINEVVSKYHLDIDIINQFGVLKVTGSVPSSKLKTHRSTKHTPKAQINEGLDNKIFEFIHKSVLEYLAACKFKDLLSLPEKNIEAKESAEFIASHRYEVKYLMFIKFLTGMVLSNDNSLAVTRLFEALTCNVDGELKLGIDNDIKLLMHLLSQARVMDRDGNQILDPRIPNLEKIVSVIDYIAKKELPTVAKTITESGYISEGILNFLFGQIESRKIPLVSRHRTESTESDYSIVPKSAVRQITQGSKEEKTSEEINDLAIDIDIDTPFAVGPSSRSSIRAPQSTDSLLNEASSPMRASGSGTSLNEDGIRKKGDASVFLTILAIKTIYGLLDKLDSTDVFKRLMDILKPFEASQIKHMAIFTIAKILETQVIEDDLVQDFISILRSDTVSRHNSLSSIVKYALKIATGESDEIIARSDSHPEGDTPVQVSSMEEARLLERSLSKAVGALRISTSDKVKITQVLSRHLIDHEKWKDNENSKRMEVLLNLLSYTSEEANGIEVPGFRGLLEVTKKALQIQINNMNDNSDFDWFIKNFDQLENITPKVMEWLFLKAISDNDISQKESEFIYLCIRKFGFSIIIKSPEITLSDSAIEYKNTILYNGVEYVLKGSKNHEAVQQIIQNVHESKETVINIETILKEIHNNNEGILKLSVVIEYIGISESKSPTEIESPHYFNEVKNNQQEDLFTLANSGSGIEISAKDIKSYPGITQKTRNDDSGMLMMVSDNNALVSFIYQADQNKNLQGSFILVEKRNPMFGRIEAHKISVLKGKIQTNIFMAHPNSLKDPEFLQRVLPMPYDESTGTKTRYHTRTLEITPKQAEDLLIKAASEYIAAPQGSSPKAPGSSHGKLTFSFKKSHQDNSFIPDSVENNAQALHRLLSSVINLYGYQISGFWSADKHIFTMHNRAIIGESLRRQDSLEIDLLDFSKRLGVLEEFEKQIDFDLLVRLLDKEQQSEEDQQERMFIESDPYKAALYEGIVRIINAAYIAAQAIDSKMVKNQQNGAVGIAGNLLTELAPNIPMFGMVAGFMGKMFKAADDIIEEKKINNIISFVQSSNSMVVISDLIAREFAMLPKDRLRELGQSKVMFAEIVETAQDVAKNGPAASIVKVLFGLKDRYYSVSEEIDEDKQLGTEHAEIIGEAILELLFSGEYKPPVLRIPQKKRTPEERKAHHIVKMIAEKLDIDIKTPIVDETSGRSSEVIEGQAPTPSYEGEGESKDEGLVEHRNIDKPSTCCNIMAVTDIIYDDPTLVQEAIDQAKLNIEIRKIVGDILKQSNFFTDSEQGKELLKTVEILYGKRASNEMLNLGTNEEVAKEILEQVQEQGMMEKILNIFFGDTVQTANNNFETIIAAEDEFNSAGLYQYLWNARGNNFLTKSAQKLIDNINHLYGMVQRLIAEGKDYGTKFLLLNSQLEFLLEFAESGQRIHAFPPPYRPDDHGGGGGGSGGSGVFFEGEENNTDYNQNNIYVVLINPGIEASLNATIIIGALEGAEHQF